MTRPDIHTQIHELTLNTTQPVIYEHDDHGTTIHTTQAPSLLEQLANLEPPSNGTNGTGGYRSRPAAWTDPIDTLAAIDQEAAAWIRRLGDRPPPTTKERVLRVHGLWASQDDQTQRDIGRDVARWWTQARILAGWDSHAWRPDNSCPMCNERRTLRIKLADQIAFCTDCRDTWDETNIGLLAEHIRLENSDIEEEETQHERRPTRTGGASDPCR